MGLKKILAILFIIVLFVAGAAFAINVAFPNAVSIGTAVIEDYIYRGVKISVDIDNDGRAGGASTTTFTGDKNAADGNAGTLSGSDGVDGVD